MNFHVFAVLHNPLEDGNGGTKLVATVIYRVTASLARCLRSDQSLLRHTEQSVLGFTSMKAWSRIAAVLHLRCPRCHQGHLFSGLLKMHDHCAVCGLKLEPEPGFYLGSIYANYALTVLITTVSFVLLVFGAGFDKDVVIRGCLAFAVLFPVWFFRYARSIWLSLMYQVNSSDFVTSANAPPVRLTATQPIASPSSCDRPEAIAKV